jgi:hypothetical protein
VLQLWAALLQMIRIIKNFELCSMLDSLVWDGVLVLPVNAIVYLPRFLMDSLVNCYSLLPCHSFTIPLLFPCSHRYAHSVWRVKWLNAKNCGITTLVSKNKHCYQVSTSQWNWSYLKSLLSSTSKQNLLRACWQWASHSDYIVQLRFNGVHTSGAQIK